MTSDYFVNILNQEYRRHAQHGGTTLVVMDEKAYELYAAVARAAGAVPCLASDAAEEYERTKPSQILVTTELIHETEIYAQLNWAKRLGAPIVMCKPGRLIQRTDPSWQNSGIHFEGMFFLVGQYAVQALRHPGGSYCEFGVFDGRTFALAYHALKKTCKNFYAFDSFQGIGGSLSEEHTHYNDGDYYANQETFWYNMRDAGADTNRITAVPGYFEDSLLNKTPADFGIEKIVVAHIDVDVYQPALEALRFMTPALVDGALILFDDYDQLAADDNLGERRALREWLAETGYRAELYRSYAICGRAFFIRTKPEGQ
jgi:hypothetical protein